MKTYRTVKTMKVTMWDPALSLERPWKTLILLIPQESSCEIRRKNIWKCTTTRELGSLRCHTESISYMCPTYIQSFKWNHVINHPKITIFMGCLKMFKVKVYQSLPHEYERYTKLGPPIGTNQAAECRQLEQRTKSHCAPVAEDCQCCETHLTTKTNQNMDIMCCKVWENQIVHVGHVGVSLYNIV